MTGELPSGRLLDSNAAATSLLGYNGEELRAMSLASLLPPGDAVFSTSLFSELGARGVAHRPELHVRRRSGGFFPAEIRCRAYSTPTGDRYVAIIRDVSERMHLKREVHQLREELKSAQSRLLHENKLVALGQIAAGVAHDMNNPASYVLMNLDEIGDILERGQLAHKSLRSSLLAWLEGEQRERAEECLAAFPVHRVFHEGRELLAECVDGVQRMTSLVKDLRGFARIDESDVSWVAMNDVVITACKMVGPHLRRRCQLRTSLESRRQIAADRRRLVQVVTNLLMNAGQAVEETTANEPTIEVMTFDTENSVTLRVRDTGPGIAPNLRHRIFEPFFTTKAERGTGLGLSLCSDIVRQHAGTVHVLGDEGGATFEVEIPFVTGLRPTQAAPASEVRPVHSAARVLIIDDEPHLVRAYRRVLSRHHHVSVADGGAAGLAAIEKEPVFDAIVCDLTMPDVDGVRFYRCLDRVAPELKPRLIFTSGGAFTRRAEELLSSVTNLLLEKPIDSSKLLRAIEKVRNLSF